MMGFSLHDIRVLEKERNIEKLIELFRDEDREVREAAAKAVSNIGGAEAVALLIPLLGNIDRDILIAIYILGQIGDPAAIGPILHIGKAVVRQMIAISSAGVGGSDPYTEYEEIANACAESLAAIGEPAVNTLISALNEDSVEIRRFAVKTLGLAGDERAVEPLIFGTIR